MVLHVRKEKKRKKKTETESVRGWTPFRKSVRIFGPFSDGLLKRSSLLHTNSDWSDFCAYGFVSSRGTTFSRSLCENSNLQGWLSQVLLELPAGNLDRNKTWIEPFYSTVLHGKI